MQPFHFHVKIPPPGRHFSDTFPGDGQPQAAIQTAPPINSRTGQQPSTVTNEQPRRFITTDAHARVIAPPVSVETAGTTLVVVVAQVLPPIDDDSEQLLVVTLVLSKLPQTLNMTPGNDHAEDFDQPQ